MFKLKPCVQIWNSYLFNQCRRFLKRIQLHWNPSWTFGFWWLNSWDHRKNFIITDSFPVLGFGFWIDWNYSLPWNSWSGRTTVASTVNSRPMNNQKIQCMLLPIQINSEVICLLIFNKWRTNAYILSNHLTIWILCFQKGYHFLFNFTFSCDFRLVSFNQKLARKWLKMSDSLRE